LTQKKKIAISAINIFEAGPLSVLKDCLLSIENSNEFEDFEFIALVHNKNNFDLDSFKKISFFEFPKSRKSYFYRLYYEYFYFRKFVNLHKINFWFSLHDMSPNVGPIPQAVYCHNVSAFKKVEIYDLFIQPTIFLFTLFYSLIYRINIKKNKYVIVQQLWIKDEFHKRFGVKYDKIVIAKPKESKIVVNEIFTKTNLNSKLFVFPTFPRLFKNVEVIGEAVRLLMNEGVNGFSVSITIDGTENKYSHIICNRYGKLVPLDFIGLQSRDAVYELYKNSDCLIFPSKLESWGLPISEYMQFNKPIFVADLPYAKETIGGYTKVKYFNPSDSQALADYMKEFIISNKIQFDNSEKITFPKPYVENWEELLKLLFKDN
jgi:glycosyltransferase involved in cell wall biosynthesis